MVRVLVPLPVGPQLQPGGGLHGLNAPVQPGPGGHQRGGKVFLGILVQLRGHVLHPDHVGNLHGGHLNGPAPVQDAHGGVKGYRQNQSHGDDVDDVEFADAKRFLLFHARPP